MHATLAWCCALSVFWTSCLAGGLLAIDYGADTFKISLVKPGIPFDVLLNTDSKRKIQSVIALRGDDRFVGGDALALALRYPEDAHYAPKLVLGRATSDPVIHLHQELFHSDLVDMPERRTSGFSRPDGSTFAPEQLLAMQLSHAKKLAQAAANEPVIDTIITIPAFFSQSQRKSVEDGAELAGLKLLAMIHDGSAVATNYAMTRTFTQQPEYHIFYDAGAASTQATVISFAQQINSTGPHQNSPPNQTVITVLGTGWNTTATGFALDIRIKEHLAEQFVNQTGLSANDFAKDRRAHAKLLKEAIRVKSVLSANEDAVARVEGLYHDNDFKGFWTRKEFEHSCQDILPGFIQPVMLALLASNLTMDDISSVVLVGGSTRVPMVQQALRTQIPADKLVQNVNADEAAVLGAALFGASRSNQFKTKSFLLKDLLPYGISISANASDKEAQVVFANGSILGSQNSVLYQSNNEPLLLSYNDYNNDAVFSAIHVDALNSTDLPDHPLVNIDFRLDGNGIISIAGIHIDNSTASPGVAANSLLPKNENNTSDFTVLEARMHAILNLPASIEQKMKYKDTLQSIDLAQQRKQHKEESRNQLEAYIYKVRDYLDNSDWVLGATKIEYKALDAAYEEVSAWFDEQNPENSSAGDYNQRKRELEKIVQPINTRLEHHRILPKLFQSLNEELKAAGTIIQLQNATQSSPSTAATEDSEDVRTRLENLCLSYKTWVEEMEGRQLALELHENPVTTGDEINAKIKNMQKEVRRFISHIKSSSTTQNKSTTSSTPTKLPPLHEEL